MTLWGGRFNGGMNPRAWALNASLGVDQRLALQDVRGSAAWAEALVTAGILTRAEGDELQAGLETIAAEFTEEGFEYSPTDEDIHTAIERRLEELIGPLARKLHTGRSRNDQVATDFRLWILDQVPLLDQALQDLQASLLSRAERDLAYPLPGYTHLQPAQPILMGHWWLAHFWPLHRDRDRLKEIAARTAVMPLGSGALAGCPVPIDRHDLAASLGFHTPSPNSLDGVADRDFAVEMLFWAALVGIHLSRLSEALIMFASSEFGFIILPDAYATGSSLMPQKKNPDVLELSRAKAGGLIGHLVALLVTLKGLPSAYDKDLQEDKFPLFSALDTLLAVLPVLSGLLMELQVDPERMKAAIPPEILATDLADYLVARGVPFRDAHYAVGQVVQLATQRAIPLPQVDLESYQSIHPSFDGDLYQVYEVGAALERRASYGGTAQEAVREQLDIARRFQAIAWS